MNNFAQFGSHLSDQHQGQQTGASGGKTGSAGQTDYIDKGLNDAEQKYGGKYYDAEKVKPANKIGDKVKGKFHDMTGYVDLFECRETVC
ncbi:uncharacterized protein BDW70DRAFT_158731 [Aspergillus foveolatus]|uniref:uncharacterized protein n=1 Tax=Aspergillus foveolatus TaxID=210207 RepID=UPI003CCD732A